MKPDSLAKVLREIRACTLCSPYLEPRPVLHVGAKAKLMVASQAPGLRVHQTGISFNDASGDRLREWMGVDRETFYDEQKIALAGMAFCFPGYDKNGHDKPPRRECATTWRQRLLNAHAPFQTTLLVGSYAQDWYLGDKRKSTMTETVAAWRDFAPLYIPMPHPSWRNNGWLKKNPWFEDELLPYVRRRVQRLLRD